MSRPHLPDDRAARESQRLEADTPAPTEMDERTEDLDMSPTLLLAGLVALAVGIVAGFVMSAVSLFR